ncbi:transcriptional regulator, TetR family [Paenibacillus sp. OK060]|uniref:TetR/AcrR family transcriptional regulator n=1 Tax=Paenibacillus sp. OK060 TaxID=1881034 RepID=UPI00088966B0|nr:helix-turn-helix domain-containing protein [Paenibacillus sp. OK060]SDK13080.1 transcriptional regulator, TetR family [Paenibacillus sp. OK060]
MKKEMTSMKQTRLNSILDEATKLLIEKPNASMNDIADSAKIGIATLHRYVESREQLMVYLGLRAIEVVSEAMQNIQLDEENCETYIPQLIEVLIPLGDKIFFLTHNAAIHYNPEIEGADLKLREPILHAVSLLQQKNYFRQDVNKNWIVDVLYSILFLTWQQVVSGDIARKSAASLVVDTFYHGFRAR